MLPSKVLSDTIGMIYDCALEPTLWPLTFEHIAKLLDARAAFLMVVDPGKIEASRHTVVWGHPNYIAPDVMQKVGLTVPAAIIASGAQMVVDGVYSTEDMMPYDVFMQSDFYKTWVEPQGLKDTVVTCVMKNPERFAVASFPLPRMTGDADRALLGLLAPHIRRAVTVSDALDMQTVRADSAMTTLDQLTLGVVLVDQDSRIIHANTAARSFLTEGAPICEMNGRLETVSTLATNALANAVRATQSPENIMNARGIGIPATASQGRLAILHVLPLAGTAGNRRQIQKATAAVFVVPKSYNRLSITDMLTSLFDLTVSQARVAEAAASGKGREEIAQALDLAENTVKSHMAQVYAKTGVTRQAELARLLADLAVPLKDKPK
jgi:DNA-binding CsgD family transcriptional regulator